MKKIALAISLLVAASPVAAKDFRVSAFVAGTIYGDVLACKFYDKLSPENEHRLKAYAKAGDDFVKGIEKAFLRHPERTALACSKLSHQTIISNLNELEK